MPTLGLELKIGLGSGFGLGLGSGLGSGLGLELGLGHHEGLPGELLEPTGAQHASECREETTTSLTKPMTIPASEMASMPSYG